MDYGKYKNVIECAGIAMVNDGRIFLIRPFYDFRPQRYAIPKGHLEYGETAQSCAKREFFEETGIDIEGRRLDFLTYVHTKIDRNTVKKVVVFKVDGDGNEVFCRSVRSNSGAPENIYGEYVDFSVARELMSAYQVPIVNRLIENEASSFRNFYSRKLESFK